MSALTSPPVRMVNNPAMQRAVSLKVGPRAGDTVVQLISVRSRTALNRLLPKFDCSEPPSVDWSPAVISIDRLGTGVVEVPVPQ